LIQASLRFCSALARGESMEYENCKAYKIKEPGNGICRGNDNDIGEYDEKCNTCPAYLRYKERIAEGR